MRVLQGCHAMPLAGLQYVGRRHLSVMSNARVEPDTLVLHWSGGRKEIIALYRQLARKPTPGEKKKPQESYHIGIDRLGMAGQFVDLEHAAWHVGDGWLPPAAEILEHGFVDVRTARKPPPRVVNLRSVGVCFCNRGFVHERDAPGVLAEGRPLLGAVHRNPASKSRHWEGYTKPQIDKFIELLPVIVQACPTLRIVVGHEDITNGYITGRGLWKSGSKLDPGPAFPWEEIPWSRHGLTPVRYDYERQGWAARPARPGVC